MENNLWRISFRDLLFYIFAEGAEKMKEQKPKKLKKRIFNSWLTSLVSFTLVLLMLGIQGFIVINAQQLSEYVREKIGFILVLKEKLNEVEIDRLQKIINSSPEVKSTRYIDKETAEEELTRELGEDFAGFLGYNPLFASIEVKLVSKYTHSDSLLVLEEKFLKFDEVEEVYYQKNLVDVINKNLTKISFTLLFISGLLAFIFIALLNNTIRISVYAQRFTINTMQMVGATNAFIRKPFMQRSILMGIYAAFIANLIIFGLVYSYKKEFDGIISFNDIRTLGIVFLVVFLLGLLISWLSTLFAVNKFLKMKFDELFY